MLSERNLREIFRAFILTGEFHPSDNLLQALAQASGKTEAGLREEYTAYSKTLTGDDTDPFKDDDHFT